MHKYLHHFNLQILWHKKKEMEIRYNGIYIYIFVILNFFVIKGNMVTQVSPLVLFLGLTPNLIF